MDLFSNSDLGHATNEKPAPSTEPRMASTDRKFEQDGSGQDDEYATAKWRELFTFTTKAHKFSVIIGLFFSILSGVIVPAFALFLGKIFDSFTSFGTGSLSGSSLLQDISRYAIYLVGLGGASWLLSGSYFAYWLIFGELQARSGRDKLFCGILHKEMQWFDTRDAGISALIIRLQAQIRELQLATSQPLGSATQYTTTVLAALGLAFYTSWSLTLVTLSTVPFSVFILGFFSRKSQPAIVQQTEVLTKVTKHANNAISAIDTVKCFNGQDHEMWQFASMIKDAAKHYMVQARINAFQIGFVRFILLGIFVQGFWYGNHLVQTGQKSSGEVLTAFWACLMATQTVEQLLPQFIVLEKGRTAAAALRAVLADLVGGRRVARMIGRTMPTFCDGDICFNDVSFSYPSGPKQFALKTANLFFPAGEITFVIGRSGSGKSTIANLIIGFYPPAFGSVTIDGHSTQTLDNNWLRSNVTLVQQQSVLFNESIFTNIAFGRNNFDRVTLEEIKWGLETTALQTTVTELPQGLDTIVGVGGSKLSGGQKQQITIARARLRDTPILILDEATSALDHTSRSIVMDRIREWRHGKTTVVITHDISQIGDRDYTYILDQGNIVQEGYRQTVQEDSDGAFVGLLHPRVGFPRLDTDKEMGIQIPRSRPPSIIPSFPGRKGLMNKPSIPDNLSLEVPIRRTQTRSRSRTLARLSVVNLSPFMAHMNQLSNVRLSILPVQKYPRPIEPSSPTSSYLWRDPEPPVTPTTSTMHIPLETYRALNRASIAYPPEDRKSSQPKWTRAIFCHRPRKSELPADQKTMASLAEILGTVWPRLLWPQRVLLICGFTAAFIHATAAPVFSWVFSKLLVTFYQPNGAHMAPMWSLSIIGIAVCDGTASYFQHYLLEKCGQAWIDNVRIEAFKRILDQPKEWFDEDKNSIASLTECLDRNAEEMRNLLGRFAGLVFVAVTIMIIGIAWSLIICWKLTLVGLSAAPILYGISRSFESVSGKWEGMSNDAGEAIGAVFTETFENIRTVRALTLEDYFHKKFFKATKYALKVGIRRAAYSGFFFGISDAGVIFAIALVFYYGAVLVSKGEFDTSDILSVVSLMIFSIGGANSIIGLLPQINSSRDTATRLLRLASLPYQKSHEYSGNIRIGSIQSIKLTDLNFFYPSRPVYPVLRNLNLAIPMKSSMAIVGSSGSGKSTIASLLLALYPPNPDALRRFSIIPPAISIGGLDIKDLHVPTLRSLVAIVPQSPTVFPGTISQNITYGLPESSLLLSPGNIRRAAQKAGIHTFISSFPQGYNTLIGDGGTGISGGQMQRLGIARALVRQPKVLIMDEPTSNLDPEGALQIREVVKGLVTEEGVTVVVITHNYDMMYACGWVVCLHDGGVGEKGFIWDLMRREGGILRGLLGVKECVSE